MSSVLKEFTDAIGLSQTTITRDEFLQALLQTLQMVGISLILGILIGVPIGILLVITREGGLLEKKGLHKMIGSIVNVIRSLPFIILMVAIIPFTRLIVGTSIGTVAAIVPLVVFIAPYIGRLVENSLLDVSDGVLEAAKAMGATPIQSIRYFLLPEALPSLILTFTTASISLIGASAMAGTVGGGGIGDLAVSYGYERFDRFVMITTIAVQALQSVGNALCLKMRKE